MTLYFFAFLSGLVTIFAPCIWPLLPIIFSSGASGGRKKPLGIIIGLAVSFLFFTLLLVSFLKIVPLDPEIFKILGVSIIVFFGITMLIPQLAGWLEGKVSRLSARFGGRSQNQGSGFRGGLITGAALGVVWSPCAGPILATVATVAATQGVSWSIFFIALSFVLGVSIPLFLIASLGTKIFSHMRGVNKYTAQIQQVFGVVIIIAGIMIYTGYDKVLQVKFLEACGVAGSWFTSFEQGDRITEELKKLRGGSQETQVGNAVSGSVLPEYGLAPEFEGISKWLNTENGEALSFRESLQGKVVLVDFWTYSCINCIRTLPYLKSWHEKYQDLGFTVIGVHTPEFLFEQKTTNVEAAIKRYQLPYPVAQDNQYGTWEAYQNRYWPAHYLIDTKGRIRYTHFGEGKYEETEQAIKILLEEAGKKIESDFVSVSAEAPGSGTQTRETYLGFQRMERFRSTPILTTPGRQAFSLEEELPIHTWGYTGTWNLEAERATAEAGAGLRFHVRAQKVFLVMSPGAGGASVEVRINGQTVPEEVAGGDVINGRIQVDTERLYEVVKSDGVDEYTLELYFPEGKISVYAFTFS